MKVSLPVIVIAMAVNLAAFILLADFVTEKKQATERVENAISEYSDKQSLKDPAELSIPRISLYKSIEPGIYDTTQDKWNVSADHPHFATVSMQPNIFGGNTVIYAHNSDDLFGHLDKLQSDDTVQVKLKNGKTFIYEYSSSKEVSPLDVSIFTNNGSHQLVLLTCTGKKNSMRRVVFLNLKSTI